MQRATNPLDLVCNILFFSGSEVSGWHELSPFYFPVRSPILPWHSLILSFFLLSWLEFQEGLLSFDTSLTRLFDLILPMLQWPWNVLTIMRVDHLTSFCRYDLFRYLGSHYFCTLSFSIPAVPFWFLFASLLFFYFFFLKNYNDFMTRISLSLKLVRFFPWPGGYPDWTPACQAVLWLSFFYLHCPLQSPTWRLQKTSAWLIQTAFSLSE